MRLIDADALLEKMKHRKEYVGRPSDPVCLVEDAPTVYVPQDTPLRCKTCSFFVNTDSGLCMINGLGRCSMFGGERSADDYCSKGAWLSNAVD